MKRDTRIVLGFIGAIPGAILAAATVCTWLVGQGASMQWRLLFRLMCHGKIERCLEVFGAPMPICARCVGIYAGMLLGMLAFRAAMLLRERVMRGFAFAAVIPLALDGLTQLAGLRESTNELRVATGVAAGIAFGLWILSAVEKREDESSHVLDLT